MKKILLILASGLAFYPIFPAWADPTLTETQLLSFGEIIVATNGVDSVVIAPDGSQTNGPDIPKLLPGRNGVYLLSGFAPSIPVVISVADSTLVGPGPTNATFDMHDFTFDPAAGAQTTDLSGNMTLKIGATLSTRAGVSYADGPYRGGYTLMINY
jgi:hypothetical protein